MVRKATSIFLIAILALNLMGAWAMAMPLDCGMECCLPGEFAAAGVDAFEAPGCCDLSSTTCTFETGQYEELFDEVLCCLNASSKYYPGGVHLSADAVETLTGLPAPRLFLTAFTTGHPQDTPLYISHASFLC